MSTNESLVREVARQRDYLLGVATRIAVVAAFRVEEHESEEALEYAKKIRAELVRASRLEDHERGHLGTPTGELREYGRQQVSERNQRSWA